MVDLLAQLTTLVPAMQQRAGALDRDGAFPTEDFFGLAAMGVLHAPVPRVLGGAGWGTEAAEAASLLTTLRLIGQGNLAVGRLFEAHVNALRLLFRYGDAALRERVAHEAGQGELFGLWVTDPPGGGLHIDNGRLSGTKRFCSGAGHVTRAVVTACDAAGRVRLVHVRLDAAVTVQPLTGGLAGMRAAVTGQLAMVDAPGTVFGAPDDYLREPDFSCGAWRTSAVTSGGLVALATEIRAQLAARGRAHDPHQLARIGHAEMAVETARLWMAEAATRAEAADAGADAIAYVGLARLVVEQAGFALIELAQRSLGVAALMRGSAVERLCRDLATYLRQPAADMVLTEAAMHVLQPA